MSDDLLTPRNGHTALGEFANELQSAQSATPLSDAITKAAKEQTSDGLAAGVVVADGQATAELRAKKSWASGWSIAGAVSYAKATGAAAAAFIGWSPKDPT